MYVPRAVHHFLAFSCLGEGFRRLGIQLSCCRVFLHAEDAGNTLEPVLRTLHVNLVNDLTHLHTLGSSVLWELF